MTAAIGGTRVPLMTEQEQVPRAIIPRNGSEWTAHLTALCMAVNPVIAPDTLALD